MSLSAVNEVPALMAGEESNAGAEGSWQSPRSDPAAPGCMTTGEVDRPACLASTSDQLWMPRSSGHRGTRGLRDGRLSSDHFFHRVIVYGIQLGSTCLYMVARGPLSRESEVR